jgi:hypothetical protein
MKAKKTPAKAKTLKAAKAPAKKRATVKRKKACAETGCRVSATSHGYCRLHYLIHWKHIRLNEQVKAEQRLNAYVNRLAKKYPKDYLEKIKEGLLDEDKFNQTIRELDLESEVAQKTETENEFLEKFARGIKIGNE